MDRPPQVSAGPAATGDEGSAPGSLTADPTATGKGHFEFNPQVPQWGYRSGAQASFELDETEFRRAALGMEPGERRRAERRDRRGHLEAIEELRRCIVTVTQ